MRYTATVKDKTFTVEITPEEVVCIGDRTHRVDLQSIDADVLYSLLIDNNSYEVLVEEQEGEYRVLLVGELFTVQVEDDFQHQMARGRRGEEKPSGRTAVKASMPGLVVDVLVSEGQDVFTGDILLILESMKMENEVRAPCDGQVSRVQVGPSEAVEKGQILVVLR